MSASKIGRTVVRAAAVVFAIALASAVVARAAGYLKTPSERAAERAAAEAPAQTAPQKPRMDFGSSKSY